MRPALLLPLLCASACGGNWSDDDLAFGAALPWQGDLALQLPAGTGPSAGWTATRAAADDLNELLTLLFGVMDEARAIAPSGRSAATRSWGPFTSGGSTGTQVTLEVTRAAEDRFTWTLPAQAQEVLRGETVAGPTLRQGTFTAHAELGAAATLLGLSAPLDALDTLDLSANQGATPRTLTLTFVPRAGATTSLSPTGYHLERGERSTTARFSFTRGTARTEATLTWRAMGDGRATGTLSDGPNTGATWTECWGTTFSTRYLREDWPGGALEGTESACPVFE